MIDKTTHRTVLESIYNDALQAISNNDMNTSLAEDVKEKICQIIDRAEANKGLYTVIMTLFSHKIIEPTQDIRKHQSQIEGGFAGRGKDTQYVTPFLKSVGFPAMAESGWLTRSLEQIQRSHGCQVIVNGVYTTLKYYLRLLNDPAEFIDRYVELLKSDENVKYPHQAAWNEIISNSNF